MRLISEVQLAGDYECIILDLDFAMDKNALKIWRQAHAVIWVGDGSEISNTKVHRAFTALSISEQNEDAPLMNRISLIYNKFSNKTGKAINVNGLREIGGAPRYEHAGTEQILKQLAGMEMFDKLI